MRRIVILLVCVLLTVVVSAQDITPPEAPAADATVAITYPPPVFILTGIAEIRGTADVVNLAQYHIEYRPLVFDDTVNADSLPWFPATLPRNGAVRNNVLGIWNTTTASDGIYELQLVVQRTDGTQETFRVSPIRVLNDPSLEFGGLPQAIPSATPISGSTNQRPTLVPTPTSLNSGAAMVTALVDANVRRGDDTSYPTVGALLTGESAMIIGISSSGSGWYYVELANGRRGFVAPSIVQASGNLGNLQRYSPPATPTPLPTATPVTSANLQITGLRLDPVQPRCGEAFDIYINVTNTGSGATNTSGVVQITDRHVASGSTTASTTGGFPVLQPGQDFVVVATLTTTTFYEETHQVSVQVDSVSQIPETNESDNFSAINYTLDQAACG